LTYTFSVTNDSAVSMIGHVDDPTLGPITGPCVGTIAAGATAQCTATYTTTAADVAAQRTITNTATAYTALSSDTSILTPVTSSSAVVTWVKTGAISVVKTVDSSTFTQANDVLHYKITVVNNTNASADVTLTDALSGLVPDPAYSETCLTAPFTLASGDSIDCHAMYLVLDTDVTAGTITNTATAAVSGESPIDSNEVVSSLAALELTKSATINGDAAAASPTDEGAFMTQPGDLVEYTLTATNIGQATLYGVDITDPYPVATGFIGSGATPVQTDCDATLPTTLAAGASVTCHYSYSVDPGDVDVNGPMTVENDAQAMGSTVQDVSSRTLADLVTAEASTNIYAAALELIKSAAINGNPAAASPTDNGAFMTAAGDLVVYTLTATNKGMATLYGVDITDPFPAVGGFSGSGSTPVQTDCDATLPTTLLAGDAVTCHYSYSVDPGDVAVTGPMAVENDAQAVGYTVQDTSSRTAVDTVAGQASVTIYAKATPLPPKPPCTSHCADTGGSLASGGLPGALGTALLIGAAGVVLITRRRLAINS